MTRQNQAAWFVKKGRPFEIGPAPYVAPRPDEVVIKNHAVAINPVDWMLQCLGNLAFSWLKCPFILGSDVVGEIVAIGENIVGLSKGDRVLAVGVGVGAAKQRNSADEGAFQLYTVALPQLTTVIPDTLTYADAAVLPLGVATAACGLFQSDLLALDLPSTDPRPSDRWVIIWSGSSSVGSNAVQLAVAAGYRVVSTTSPKNFSYVKSLGATEVFDYKSKSVVRDIVELLKSQQVMGALAIGAGSTPICMDIVAKCSGRKFVASCM